MLSDRERSGAYASEQRRLVRDAVAAEVLAFTPYWREAAAEAGLRTPTSPGDLLGLEPRPLSALGSPDALVLRPSPEAVRKGGPKPLKRRLRRARVGRGSAGAMRRILDPLYKPIHWIIEGDVPVGCTEADLVRLGELGRRSLELAGVGGDDAIVGLIPPGPTLSSWQLALGAREAGVPLAGLAPSASIQAVSLLGPTVLAGRPADLLRVVGGLSGSARTAVTTIISITRAPLRPAERKRLERAAGGQAVVVEWWAPPGVRALWAQCRGGEGAHTWPQAELLEVCGPDGTPTGPGEDGELVWTGLGWRGTTFVRLATGMCGRVVEDTCDSCGRTTPRVLDGRPAPGSSAVPAAETADTEAVGPLKATGRAESVRTVRARPAAQPDRAVRPSPEPARPVRRPDSIVLRATDDEGLVIRAESARDEADDLDDPSNHDGDVDLDAPSNHDLDDLDDVVDGVVRAVLKDPADVAAARAQPHQPDAITLAGAADLDHLPALAEVGPDAAGGGLDDAWLPETGEVDAWPAPVLASTDGLAAWQVEHRRRRDHDELVVHLALAEGAELAEILVALERAIGATQYVVSGEADLAARIADADGRRIVDRRSNGSSSGGSAWADAAGTGLGRR